MKKILVRNNKPVHSRKQVKFRDEAPNSKKSKSLKYCFNSLKDTFKEITENLQKPSQLEAMVKTIKEQKDYIQKEHDTSNITHQYLDYLKKFDVANLIKLMPWKQTELENIINNNKNLKNQSKIYEAVKNNIPLTQKKNEQKGLSKIINKSEDDTNKNRNSNDRFNNLKSISKEMYQTGIRCFNINNNKNKSSYREGKILNPPDWSSKSYTEASKVPLNNEIFLTSKSCMDTGPNINTKYSPKKHLYRKNTFKVIEDNKKIFNTDSKNIQDKNLYDIKENLNNTILLEGTKHIIIQKSSKDLTNNKNNILSKNVKPKSPNTAKINNSENDTVKVLRLMSKSKIKNSKKPTTYFEKNINNSKSSRADPINDYKMKNDKYVYKFYKFGNKMFTGIQRDSSNALLKTKKAENIKESKESNNKQNIKKSVNELHETSASKSYNDDPKEIKKFLNDLILIVNQPAKAEILLKELHTAKRLNSVPEFKESSNSDIVLADMYDVISKVVSVNKMKSSASGLVENNNNKKQNIGLNLGTIMKHKNKPLTELTGFNEAIKK